LTINNAAMAEQSAAVQELAGFLIQNLPHALLLVLIVLIVFLTGKDIINGFRKPFLDPTRWQPLVLVDKKSLTHNTRRFRFALPHQDQILGLPVGQHITIKALLPDGTEAMRPYTPVSEGLQRGYVDFVIKVYPQGRMSQAMDALEIGQSLQFKGPKGLFKYAPRGHRSVGMLAGGTGITPCFQLAQALLKDPNNPTVVSLIFANVTVDDILLKDELDDMAARYPDRFSVYYVLNTPPEGWKGGEGFVSAEMITKHLPAPANDVLVVRCGPLPMMKAMEAHLVALGYQPKQLFQF
jgi:cytochrome-b5 reductase